MKTSTLVTLFGLALAPLGLAQETTASLGPSPTESYGCEPHGDHYHCEGHVSETAAVDGTNSVPTPTTTPGHDDHDHDHDHEEEEHDHDHDEEDDDATGTGSLGPSPTASIGCEPHGDHWHCDGPAETGASNEVSTTGSDSPEETGGVMAQVVPLAGALAAVVLAF